MCYRRAILGSQSSLNTGEEHKPARTAVNIGISGVPPSRPVLRLSFRDSAGRLCSGRYNYGPVYDGDPNAGGKEFNAERVHYVPADGTFMVGAPYRAQICGKHDLFIVMNQGTASHVVRRASPIRVPYASHGK